MSGDDQKLMSESKYKQFITAIDKCLKNFEYSSEWADLISCLGKLNKVIQTYSQYSVVPRKLLIGKRLAQCLHPALPSGVHLKALESYDLILKQIGSARLAQDLFIYSAGLFPVLGQASIAVRPVLLDLYENHFLPLKKRLYPGLSGLLVALLPGIEEGSEYTDRTTNLLTKLCDEISEGIFFSCLWDTVLHSSMTRLSAMLFVIGYIGKKPGNAKDIVIGKDVNLMVNAVCASLDDSNVLVQRITLDFAMNFITFHSIILSEKHLVKLLTYALGVLLRRDMSLNRRIFQWLLNVNSDGSTVNKVDVESDGQNDDEISKEEISYFDLYVREPLTVAMIILFQNVLETVQGAFEDNELTSKHRQAHLKPFRILITLLDKPEVGSAILDDLMLEIFRTLHKHSEVKNKLADINMKIGKEVSSVHNELIKSANLLFNSLEPFFIWEYLSKTLRKCFVKSPEDKVKNGNSISSGLSSLIDVKIPTHLEIFNLISYLLDIVTVETSVETQSEHWPNLLRSLIQEMMKNISDMDLCTLLEGISLISKLFSRLSPTFPNANQEVISSFSSTVLATTTAKSPPTSPLQTEFDISFETNSIASCIDLSKALFLKFVTSIVLKKDKQIMMVFQEETNCPVKFHAVQFFNHKNFSESDPEKSSMEEHSYVIAQTFQIFCQYLVRVSCFPIAEEFSPGHQKDKGSKIPEWLQGLISSCCYGYSFDIQSAALSTLLDLINVTLTVQDSNERTAESSSKIIPLISSKNLRWIQQSNLFQVLANSLWKRLTPSSCQYHKGAVDLFLQLHNITPSSNTCEDVINSAMVVYDLSEKEMSHWRFSLLWHLSRDFYKDDNNKANKGTRTIDKCMFLMIDSLQSDSPKIRECAKLWLQHSVSFGDIGRILETILLILLHPVTSRIAIHYAPLMKKKKGQQVMEPLKDTLTVNEMENVEKEPITSEDDEKDIEQRVLSNNSTVSHSRSTSQMSGFADDEDDDDDEYDDEDDDEEENDKTSLPKKAKPIKTVPTHPLLIHKLLYTQHYDTQQCLYALKHISMVLKVEGRAFICSAATTSMNVCNTPHQSLLRELLIRHRRVLSGKEFYGSLADAHQLLIRASTAKYLEILLSVCLYFIRSDFHQHLHASSVDMEGNFTVQEASAEVLTQVVYLLLDIARDSGKGFSVYVNDLLSRSKIQRIGLHCLLSTIYAVTGDYRESNESGFYSMVECPNLTDTTQRCTPLDLQTCLLKFIESLIFLESCIGTENVTSVNPTEKKGKARDKLTVTNAPPFEYVPFKPIVSQPMFISATLTVLREKKWMHLHNNWVKLLISCLPKFNQYMSKIIVPVVYQLCANLKTVTKIFKESYSTRKEECLIEIPPDYMLVLLNGITSFCHYCLISTTTGGTLSSTAGRVSSKHKNSVDESVSLFSNLVHVFSTSSSTPSKTTSEEGSAALNETRDGLLGILPAILTAVSAVWKVWDVNKLSAQPLTSKTPLAIGQPKAVRLSILQLITPIAMNHTIVFLASLSDVWCLHREASFSKPPQSLQCKEWLQMTNKKYIPKMTEDQCVLLEIIQAIKVLTLQTILETSKQVLRQLLSMKERSQPVALDVCMLQFLYELLSKASDDIIKIRSALLSLLKDALSLNMAPPSLFLLLAILNIYVQRVPIPEDRRSRRDLQDLVQRFLDSLNTIAASSLEGSAWFRRSLQVVTQLDQSIDLEESSLSDKSSVPEVPVQPNATSVKTSQYSVAAILILAEYLAPMLDMVYLSEEKDKIASLLVYLIYNIIPYLKNHSNQNNAGYRACSALLAAISDYQYTLRAWRKDIYELFLDSDFFQMDLLSFRFWRIIIDRLITYDNTVFKDLMQKIVLSQSGAINIFANREQEMEQRAQLLKRLSFAIFCGEHDQYHQYLPDIQERLAESIRQLQGPFLHEQVFLCFRLLLVRMSPNHLISLWPPILTELVLVFVHMEHELSNAGKPKNKSKVAVLESFLGINGYFKDPSKWLRLYLAVCKLLDFLLILPSDSLSHYQVYKWAFSETPGIYCSSVDDFDEEEVNSQHDVKSSKSKDDIMIEHKSRIRRDGHKTNGEELSKMAVLNAPISEKKRHAMKEKQKLRNKENYKQRNVPTVFLPYITRIVKLLHQKNLGEENWQTPLRVPGELILLQKKIQSIYDLLPFFITVTGDLAKQDVDVSKLTRFKLQHIEDLIEKDFIEYSSALT